jgi:hypothetical protein
MSNEVRQAHPEPVAYLWEHSQADYRQLHFQGDNSELPEWKVTPLYAAPPVQPAPALPRAMAWGRLYEAINKVVVQIGRDGEVCSRHACVEWLQECLHEIDGGQYMPGLMPGQPAPALSMKRDEWRTLSPEAQAKLERITGAEHPDTKRAKAQAAENVRNVPLGAVQPAPVPPSQNPDVHLAGSQECAPAAREADSRSEFETWLNQPHYKYPKDTIRDMWDAWRAARAAPSGVPQDSAPLPLSADDDPEQQEWVISGRSASDTSLSAASTSVQLEFDDGLGVFLWKGKHTLGELDDAQDVLLLLSETLGRERSYRFMAETALQTMESARRINALLGSTLSRSDLDAGAENVAGASEPNEQTPTASGVQTQGERKP